MAEEGAIKNGAVSSSDVKIDDAQMEDGGILAAAEHYWTTSRNGAVKLRIGTTQYDNMAPITIPKMFQDVVAKIPTSIALAVKRQEQWQKWTYKEYYDTCATVAKGFIKLGLEKFSSVGILGFNSPEWFFSKMGAIFAGGLACGIYTTNSPEACQFVADNCSANIIVVENKSQLDKILKVWDELPNLKAVIQYTGELQDKTNPNVYEWGSFLELGKSCGDDELNERLRSLKANQCCSLIYTSGTTGTPKGVMLSHDNIYFTAKRSLDFVGANFGQEHVLSFLPLSHIAAQLADVYMAMISGGTTWFAQPDALKGSLATTLKEVRPTLFLAVPRVWEKIMEKMLETGRTITGFKRKMADWGKGKLLQGNKNLENGDSVPFLFSVADKIVGKKVRNALGFDRCHHLATAAAPITMETLQYYQSLNLPLYELYGMSESTGPHTVGKRGRNLTGSCGTSMEGFTLKIDKPDEDGNGEICMKGRHVFMGYLNQEEKTKEILDDEGFLHSGDIGKVDKNGFLFITGRIKELIITAGGENIAPVPIEEKIKTEVPIISNAMLIGDKRKFVSCLITLKVVMNLDTGEPTDQLTEAAKDFCKQHGCEATTVSEILNQKPEKLMKAIQDGIDKHNESAISRAQKVQKWNILEHDFSIPTGELGPTMKMRRPIIHKMYAETIDAFYQ